MMSQTSPGSGSNSPAGLDDAAPHHDAPRRGPTTFKPSATSTCETRASTTPAKAYEKASISSAPSRIDSAEANTLKASATSTCETRASTTPAKPIKRPSNSSAPSTLDSARLTPKALGDLHLRNARLDDARQAYERPSNSSAPSTLDSARPTPSKALGACWRAPRRRPPSHGEKAFQLFR